MKRTIIALLALVLCNLSQNSIAEEKKEAEKSTPPSEVDLGDTIRVLDVIEAADVKMPAPSEYNNCYQFLQRLQERKIGIKEISDDYVLAQLDSEMTFSMTFPDRSCADAAAKTLAKDLMVP